MFAKPFLSNSKFQFLSNFQAFQFSQRVGFGRILEPFGFPIKIGIRGILILQNPTSAQHQIWLRFTILFCILALSGCSKSNAGKDENAAKSKHMNKLDRIPLGYKNTMCPDAILNPFSGSLNLILICYNNFFPLELFLKYSI